MDIIHDNSDISGVTEKTRRIQKDNTRVIYYGVWGLVHEKLKHFRKSEIYAEFFTK